MSYLDTWETPLSAEEREKLIAPLVEIVARRGLQTPVLLLLEIHKPLAFVASQGIIAAAPLLGPLIGLQRMQAVGRLLAQPGGLDELINRIESSANEDKTAQSAEGKTA